MSSYFIYLRYIREYFKEASNAYSQANQYFMMRIAELFRCNVLIKTNVDFLNFATKNCEVSQLIIDWWCSRREKYSGGTFRDRWPRGKKVGCNAAIFATGNLEEMMWGNFWLSMNCVKCTKPFLKTWPYFINFHTR